MPSNSARASPSSSRPRSKAPDRLLDEREQDEALRAAHARRRPRCSARAAFLSVVRAAGVVAEQVVDLAEDDLGLRAARRVAELLVALERLHDERPALRRLRRGRSRCCPSRRSALASRGRVARLLEGPAGLLGLGARLLEPARCSAAPRRARAPPRPRGRRSAGPGASRGRAASPRCRARAATSRG